MSSGGLSEFSRMLSVFVNCSKLKVRQPCFMTPWQVPPVYMVPLLLCGSKNGCTSCDAHLTAADAPVGMRHCFHKCLLHLPVRMSMCSVSPFATFPPWPEAT